MANKIPIYQIVKAYHFNRQKLTKTVRKIQENTGYPLLTKFGRVNLVDNEAFKKIVPFLKKAWSQEANRDVWRNALKKGFTKSRATQYMKRKIINEIVPPYYFDIVPFSFDRLLKLKSTVRQPMTLPNTLKEDKHITYEEIIDDLIPSLLSELIEPRGSNSKKRRA